MRVCPPLTFFTFIFWLTGCNKGWQLFWPAVSFCFLPAISFPLYLPPHYLLVNMINLTCLQFVFNKCHTLYHAWVKIQNITFAVISSYFLQLDFFVMFVKHMHGNLTKQRKKNVSLHCNTSSLYVEDWDFYIMLIN